MISETASDLAYRGHNRQVVFVSDEDYFYYQENLKEWKENLGISRTRETKEGKKINLSPFLCPLSCSFLFLVHFLHLFAVDCEDHDSCRVRRRLRHRNEYLTGVGMLVYYP